MHIKILIPYNSLKILNNIKLNYKCEFNGTDNKCNLNKDDKNDEESSEFGYGLHLVKLPNGEYSAVDAAGESIYKGSKSGAITSIGIMERRYKKWPKYIPKEAKNITKNKSSSEKKSKRSEEKVDKTPKPRSKSKPNDDTQKESKPSEESSKPSPKEETTTSNVSEAKLKKEEAWEILIQGKDSGEVKTLRKEYEAAEDNYYTTVLNETSETDNVFREVTLGTTGLKSSMLEYKINGKYSVFSDKGVNKSDVGRIVEYVSRAPPALQDKAYKIYLTKSANPNDEINTKRYGSKFVSSACRSRDGSITCFNSSRGRLAMSSTIYHELGHSVDGTEFDISGGSDWKNAVQSDGGNGVDSYSQDSMKVYGKTSRKYAEDFAVSISEYTMNKEQFEKKYPNRSKILRRTLRA